MRSFNDEVKVKASNTLNMIVNDVYFSSSAQELEAYQTLLQAMKSEHIEVAYCSKNPSNILKYSLFIKKHFRLLT